MTHHDIFDSLTRNAFDFLERAIAEFDKYPKYSVIHFCAAVEMLLKARLMKEHWSLIVSKTDQANLANFMAGDFISVTLENARARIRDVAGEDIGDDAYASFRALANHRNKMVHFFHNGLESDEKAKAQIVAEHCRSWFHLHRLLSRWSGYFHDFGSEIASADRAMLRHRKYLSAKFKVLKPELDADRKAGNISEACPACGYKALNTRTGDRHVSELCRVCGYESPSHKAIQQGDEQFVANCANCDGIETVIKAGFGFKCTECNEIFDEVETCGYCNANWGGTGDSFGDAATGCDHCGGMLANIRDD
ncbi:MAG: hypothetical protein LBI87_00550 [Candidatus Accumulibacter sp.]|jgi:hypothetical protein|nr:hypothetical protein [Accumulibacter sp.]